MPTLPLHNIRYLLIDLDGVIYEGNTPLPGAIELFRFMRGRGIQFRLVTNNSSRTRQMYVDKLAALGINVAEDDVFTSGMATARYMATIAPAGTHVMVIGETGLIMALKEAGFVVNGDHPEYVVAGFDSFVNYEKLKNACLAISKGGARFIAANPDQYIPTEVGRLPGCGAISAFITACTDVRPHVVGKPEKEILDLALESMCGDKQHAALIGDRLDTDILGGHKAGITSILVLTGVTALEDLERSEIKPDYVFSTLRDFQQQLVDTSNRI